MDIVNMKDYLDFMREMSISNIKCNKRNVKKWALIGLLNLLPFAYNFYLMTKDHHSINGLFAGISFMAMIYCFHEWRMVRDEIKSLYDMRDFYSQLVDKFKIDSLPRAD